MLLTPSRLSTAPNLLDPISSRTCSRLRTTSKVSPATDNAAPVSVIRAVNGFGGPERRPRVCVAGFRVLNNFHKIYSCSFVKADPTGPTLPDESRWTYVHFWLNWFICVVICFLVMHVISEALHALPPRRHFNVDLFGFFIMTTNTEGFLGGTLMRVYRHRWVEIINLCERIEANLSFRPEAANRMRLTSSFIATFQFMILVMNGGINAINDFGMGLWSHYGIPMPAMVRLMSYAVSAVVAYLIPVNATTARIWMMYFGHLFSVYVRRMSELLNDVLENGGDVETKIIVVDNLRIQLNNIRMIVEKLSSILGVGMLYGYGYSTPVLCVSGFFVTMPDLSIRVRAFFGAFAVGHSLCMLIPIWIVTQISKEIRELKEIIVRVPAKRLTPVFQLHLALLERAASGGDFRIDACGFFKVDLNLFMNIMGASITYTVMLAQTNNQIFQMLLAQQEQAAKNGETAV